MNRILIVILAIVLIACGGKEEKGEAVDFEKWAGETGVEEEIVDTANATEPDQLITMHTLINQMQPEYDTSELSEFHPIDRFNFSDSRKLKFVGKNQVPYGKSNMVTPVAEFYYYSFLDSNKTVSAFYNYLDIMAEEGEGGPVKLKEDVEAIKSPPMFMVVYDTVIVSARYKCEHEKNNWRAFQNTILDIYGKEYKYQIDVDCGGPLKWK